MLRTGAIANTLFATTLLLWCNRYFTCILIATAQVAKINVSKSRWFIIMRTDGGF